MMATCRCQLQSEAISMPRAQVQTPGRSASGPECPLQALGGLPQEAEGVLRLQTSW